MKYAILTSFLTCMSFVHYGQEFAAVGTEWHYDEKFPFAGAVSYVKLTSEKDTLVNGKLCKKITKRRKFHCNQRLDVEYVYANGDRVYFYDPVYQEFQILYDFGAEVTDSWDIKIQDEYLNTNVLTVTVDSISTTSINGVDLKTLHVTYFKNVPPMPYSYGGTIVEQIGDLLYLFNWTPVSINIACDRNYSGGLRCYDDALVGSYSTGIADSCTYEYVWSSTNEIDADAVVTCFPNPTQNTVEIAVDGHTDYTITLYDLNGKLLKSKKSSEANIVLDLSDLADGMYILLLLDDDQVVGYDKLVKN